ncbi:MAG: hypothetical protein IKI75_03985 [Lachnospiraceae bacterium]|nr:hypothetical protein [Lachnospiraceae bacterium]
MTDSFTITDALTGLMLALGSIMDIKEKKLSLLFLSICGAVAVPAALISGDTEELLPKLAGLTLGFGILLLGKISGCLGTADGVLIMLLGLVYGGSSAGELLMYSLLFAAAASFILIVFRKADIKTTLPFLPFLFAGFIVFTLRKGG